MKKTNIEIHLITKAKFQEKGIKIENFLQDNFELPQNGSKLNRARVYTTNDRNNVLKLVNGLKSMRFSKFNHDEYELFMGKWEPSTSLERTKMEEENVISYVWKGITSTGKLAMALYVSIAEENGTYIVSISDTATWKGYSSKRFDKFKLQTTFCGTMTMAAQWSNTINAVIQQKSRIRFDAKIKN